jgi:uncharacterized protein YjiS (DUF1127 family)
MVFPETDKDLEEAVGFNESDLDAISIETDSLDDPDLLGVSPEFEIGKAKPKTQQSQQGALKIRRGIEDYFEKKRLRQELDYLLDEKDSDNEK